ncbi:MAG: radical SAM protein [Spirochaetales bacterium]|nr:radical SAM protein [Spirochaetales bacterium]
MKVNEIFYSIQGESLSTGLPTIFLRLTGCNLRCSYCDTRYSYDDGAEFSVEEVLRQIKGFSCKRLCITGGEPLLQRQEIFPLIEKLPDYQISIETNGSLPVGDFLRFGNLSLVVDVKSPASLESANNHYENLSLVRPQDQVKFVLADRDDYEFAKKIINDYQIKATKLFSCIYGRLEPQQLVEWILADNLDVRFQLQIHKFIWDSNKRGV